MSLLGKVAAYQAAVRAREAARQRVNDARQEMCSAQVALSEANDAEQLASEEMRTAMLEPVAAPGASS